MSSIVYFVLGLGTGVGVSVLLDLEAPWGWAIFMIIVLSFWAGLKLAWKIRDEEE